MATSIQILRQIKFLDEKQNQLIIMDKVFGLADNSDDWLVFWQFRETLNTAVLCFYIIYLETPRWKIILSQKKIFNIFPGSVEQSIMLKNVSENCVCGMTYYLPQNALWTNRFFVNLANRNNNVCLALDCLLIQII